MTDQYDIEPWLSGFTIPEAPTGAVLALTFGASGIWTGRVDGRRRIVASLSEPRIVPSILDMRIAAELTENGSVPEASEPAVFDELTELVRRARDLIDDRDSTFVMGTGTLRFISVSRADIVEATVPEVNRIHGMIVELAGTQPVDAILLGPGTDQWPGLWESLTERGFTALLPGDRFPDTFGGDDDPTNTLARIDEAPVALAWGAQPSDSGPASFSASGIDPADYRLDEYGNVQFDSSRRDQYGDTQYGDIQFGDAGYRDDPNEARRAAESKRRWQITAAAAILVLVGLGGVGTAVATNIHEHNGPSIDELGDLSASDTTSETESSAPAHIPNSADRKEVAAARAKMLKYSTPPPPPKPTPTTTQKQRPQQDQQQDQQQTQERPRPGPPPLPKPRKRTIPNPIPGLPPIVVG
ncbi:hypothetical protein L5I01_22000 [Gordonia sp. HY442]|uniref:hypothetical protein n=1 Tax=Gordonia zhenghanii TaxID=2911516 RepID=UPI001F197EEA|nr:hypothetical protein [Gordonia zhenghanii]MCF8606029.1 hypothetical protein [Gordonia zhenghanii]